jgi:relaxasome subunit mobC
VRIKSHEPPSLRFQPDTAEGIKPMTENEKKLLQAKHRLEEAEMRDRQKERKARTRRLIQEGAILEKALPQTTQMTLEQLENFLWEVFKTVR